MADPVRIINFTLGDTLGGGLCGVLLQILSVAIDTARAGLAKEYFVELVVPDVDAHVVSPGAVLCSALGDAVGRVDRGVRTCSTIITFYRTSKMVVPLCSEVFSRQNHTAKE